MTLDISNWESKLEVKRPKVGHGHWERKCKFFAHIFVTLKWINLRQTKTILHISSDFPAELNDFCDICLSVCRIPFVYSPEWRRKSILYGKLATYTCKLWSRSNFEIQRTKIKVTENNKSRSSRIIFVKSGSIFMKSTSKWSSVHSIVYILLNTCHQQQQLIFAVFRSSLKIAFFANSWKRTPLFNFAWQTYSTLCIAINWV